MSQETILTSNLVIASQNKYKCDEIRSILLAEHIKVETLLDLSTQLPFNTHQVERAATYYENALSKALRVWEVLHIPVLSDDSGFEVMGLGGVPGVFSSSFGGNSLSQDDRNNLILYLMEKKGLYDEKDRHACYRSVFCYYNGSDVPQFFEGVLMGYVLSQSNKEGNFFFGYDPIFFSYPHGLPFGSISLEDKSKLSHRSIALQKFINYYKYKKVA